MASASTRCSSTTPDEDLEVRLGLYLKAKHPALSRISVAVHSGTARLWGAVGSFYLRQLAIAATTRVAGVRQVIDDIEVCLPRIAAIDHEWLEEELNKQPATIQSSTFNGRRPITASTENVRAFLVKNKDSFTGRFELQCAASAD